MILMHQVVVILRYRRHELTEAFVVAHTEVLRQLLQTQQQMAQQLP
jgi:hypothetical protein